MWLLKSFINPPKIMQPTNSRDLDTMPNDVESEVETLSHSKNVKKWHYSHYVVIFFIFLDTCKEARKMYQICLHFSHESSVCEWTLPKQYSPSIQLNSKGSFLTEKTIIQISFWLKCYPYCEDCLNSRKLGNKELWYRAF